RRAPGNEPPYRHHAGPAALLYHLLSGGPAAAGRRQAAGPRSGRPDSLDPGRSRRDRQETEMTERPSVTIAYCTQCNWLLRAAWKAQELLSTFSTGLGRVTLIPGTGGI